MTTTATTADVRAAIEAQGKLAPGESGWWEVWGATPFHIQPGDYVMLKTPTGVDEFYVSDTFVKEDGLRKGVVIDGESMTIGVLNQIVLWRQGTHNTLAK